MASRNLLCYMNERHLPVRKKDHGSDISVLGRIFNKRVDDYGCQHFFFSSFFKIISRFKEG